MRPSARLAALAFVLAPLTACAYFNGVYNARQAESRGDALVRSGRLADADSAYALAAVTAETVLARYPKSKWRDDALRIAGRGWARAQECDRAIPRLRAYLFEFDAIHPAREREPTQLALGECFVRTGRLSEARETLAPLAEHRDAMGRAAALWAARAAIAKGDDADARRFLSAADASEAEWEMVRYEVARERFDDEEAALARRAAAGDGRAAADTALAALWRAGRSDAVLRTLAAYDAARTPAADRARLHLAVGELFFASGADSLAARQYEATEQLSRDTLVVRDAVARLALLALRPLAAQVDVENMVRASRVRAKGGALQRRLDDNLLLMQMLGQRQDFTGASLFLAAEVARDSLRATALAHALFKRIVSSSPQSPLAAKALLAAARLAPDSADGYVARVRREYPLSPYLALAPDSAGLARLDAAEKPLSDAWIATVAVYTDSVKRLHPGALSAIVAPVSPAPTASGAMSRPTTVPPP
ncbi:MAG: hypothetical protein ABJD07_06385 [Gemmatimonadaceae bacterium]